MVRARMVRGCRDTTLPVAPKELCEQPAFGNFDVVAVLGTLDWLKAWELC